MFNPQADVVANPVKLALSQSPLLMILFAALAIFGIVVQVRQNRNYTIATYNRWETV
jgi:hypothetical protein